MSASASSCIASLVNGGTPPPLDQDESRRPKFIMDYSLFRVAKQLRLLGYDAACSPMLRGPQIVLLAQLEKRIVVCGSRKLLPQLESIGTECNPERVEKLYPVAPPKMVKRRVIVGYNSDGESEYETDEDEDDMLLLDEEEEEEIEEDDEVDSGSSHDIAGKSDDDGKHNSKSSNGEQGRRRRGQKKKTTNMLYIAVNTTRFAHETLAVIIQSTDIAWDVNYVFTRCVGCNMRIQEVPKKSIADLVHPTVYRLYTHFYQCDACMKVYWGVDNGTVVNYKALRTMEGLQQLCAAAGAKIITAVRASSSSSSLNLLATEEGQCDGDDQRNVMNSCEHTSNKHTIDCSGGSGYRASGLVLKRHFFSYPRKIKCSILSFLTKDELGGVLEALPMFTELITTVMEGRDFKFVPEPKAARKKRWEDAMAKRYPPPHQQTLTNKK